MDAAVAALREGAESFLTAPVDPGQAARLAIEFQGAASNRRYFYEGVDVDEIWQMITVDLPPLLRWVEPFLPPSP